MAVSKGRRFMTGAVAIAGAGAMGLAMAAPANAAVTGVSITSPSGYGSVSGTYGTGCSYTVTATINNTSPRLDVEFTATLNNQNVTSTVLSPSSKTPTGSTATTTFTPTARGTYTITARQAGSDPQSTTAKVGTGISLPDTGSVNLSSSGACLVVIP